MTQIEKPFQGELCPGMTVLWYKTAAVEIAKPIPALVIEGFHGGTCDLLIADVPGIGSLRKTAVYHKSSPSLLNHFGTVSDSAKAYGCWDFCPHTEAADRRFTDKQEREREKRAEEIAQQAIEFAAEREAKRVKEAEQQERDIAAAAAKKLNSK